MFDCSQHHTSGIMYALVPPTHKCPLYPARLQSHRILNNPFFFFSSPAAPAGDSSATSFFLSFLNESLELKLGEGEELLPGIKLDTCFGAKTGAGGGPSGGGGARDGGPTGSVQIRESRILASKIADQRSVLWSRFPSVAAHC
jgi:hypothetical protein